MTRTRSIAVERLTELVEQCVRREMAPGALAPSVEEDLVDSGAVDSMAWVSVMRCIEAATGNADFGEQMLDQPRSIRAMVSALQKAPGAREQAAPSRREPSRGTGALAEIAGWGSVTGGRVVTAAELEHEFKLKAGKVSKSAGIESVARVAKGEDEITLAMRAVETALAAAGAGIGDVECIIASSETLSGYPSLGARLHAQMLADERCGALDVGGACLGAVNALAVAQQFIATGRHKSMLIVTADVHSRVLTPARVKGEFGALFGDGASAFLLRPVEGRRSTHYCVGEVTLGCDASASAAIRISLNSANGMDLTFEGEALSRAAVGKLEALIADLELRTGLHRKNAVAFATHQPNPRLVSVLAKQLGVPLEKFPPVARTCGNLGSSMCGVALARALDAARAGGSSGPIFVASLGPGLLFGSTVLTLDHP